MNNKILETDKCITRKISSINDFISYIKEIHFKPIIYNNTHCDHI